MIFQRVEWAGEEGVTVLYELLKERTKEQSISHKQMPTWDEHVEFVESNPYEAWDLILVNGEYVGSIYLTKNREIGLFVFKKHQGKGYGSQALDMMRRMHPGPVLANVNPNNEPSRRFWEKAGAKLLQVTYELK